MSNIITIKTGTSAPTSGVLAIGELGFDTVAGKVYIGADPGVPIELGPGSPPDDYIGATSETIGVHGLVPAAETSEYLNFLRGDGTWSEVNLPSDYIGATAGAAGVHGLVPAAQTSQSTYFLRGNGSWTAVTPSLIGAAAAKHASRHASGGADALTPAAIGAARVSSTVSAVLAAASWVGSSAPYTYTLAVSGVTATSAVEVIPTADITVEQFEAIQGANIAGGTQSAGSIVLRAFGDKPTIELPVLVIVRGDL